MYAFITGATGGIGAAFADELASKGYHLILIARNSGRLSILKKSLKQKYPNQTFRIDVADLSDAGETLRIAKKYMNYPVSLVVQCAGFGKWGTIGQIPLEEETELIETNITASHILAKFFAAHMKQGRILNVASLAGFVPTPLMAAYAASKSYVISYSLALDYELRKMKRPVRISVLCPGPINTRFQERAGSGKCMQSISCKKCVRYAMKQMKSGKKIIIPGFLMRCAYIGTKLLPLSALLALEYRIQSKKS